MTRPAIRRELADVFGPRAPSFRHLPAVEVALSPIAALVTVGAGVLAWQAVWLGAWRAVLSALAGAGR